MNIVEKDGIKALRFPDPAVAVIAYTMEDGILNEIGIVKENNPHFENKQSESIITGAVETNDSSLLQRAAVELKEEGGYEVADTDMWSYLGDVYMTKISPDSIHIFAANVTGLKAQIPKGDTKEKIYSYTLVPVQEALKLKDSLLHTAFFKLFMQIYKKEFKPTT